jgi:hypothetical protein
MTQPDYVPLDTVDRVRPVERLPAPKGWVSDRPADEKAPVPPSGARFGRTGPDLGYGLKLAGLFRDRIQLGPAESVDDAIAGCFAVGGRRAASFGRAPVIYDMELAFTVWGFLGDAPAELVEFRADLFPGVAHDYGRQRLVADLVTDEALRLTPAQAAAQLGEWRTLLHQG